MKLTPTQICATFFIITISLLIISLGTYYGIMSNGINIVIDDEVETVTQTEFLDKENDREFDAVFKGIIEKQSDTEHIIGNLTEHFSNKDKRHEIDLKILSEGHYSTRIGLIAGAIVLVFGIAGVVLIIIYKMYVTRQSNGRPNMMVQHIKSVNETNDLFPPVHLS